MLPHRSEKYTTPMLKHRVTAKKERQSQALSLFQFTPDFGKSGYKLTAVR
jgi:hypothetical protein